MAIFRSDFLTALNDLATACHEAAQQYAAAASASAGQPLSRSLAQLESQYRPLIEQLDQEIRRRDDLPSPPAEEMELLQTAAAHIESAVATSSRSLLLDDCLAAEEAVVAANRKALDLASDGEARSLLQRLGEHAKANIATLRSKRRTQT